MRHHSVVAALLLASSVLTPALSVAPVAAAEPATRTVQQSGHAQLVSRADGPGAGLADPEFAPDADAAREAGQGSEVELRTFQPPAASATAAAAAAVAAPQVATTPNVTHTFDGLNARNQRTANGGNQFTVEPPDQGLCVGNGFVMESINDVLRVYNGAGQPVSGVIDLNTFYGYPAQFNRTTGAQGPFVTDPSCLYDQQTGRWFQLVLTLEVFPDTGDFTGQNHLDLAVSNTSNPLDGFGIYRLDVTDDGTNGTPNHGCPPGGPVGAGHHAPTHPNACIGDFPHIGADQNGVYLTTNEYCLFCAGIGFHAAQIYAFSKRALTRGDNIVGVSQIDTLGRQAGKPGFTVWPATSPTTADYALDAGGTEYFLSSNAAEEVSGVRNSTGLNHSNQIVVWALSNTSSLRTTTANVPAVPHLSLLNVTVGVDEYSVPNPSNQKPGNFPLGQCLNDTTITTPFGQGCWSAILVKEPKHNEVEGPLDSSDSRVLSATYANGFLWGTLDTNVSVGGKTKAGVHWFIITPHLLDGGNSAFLVRQGHIAVPNNNAIYGAVAATHLGRAVIGFTLVGDDHYPSAAYINLNSPATAADIHVIAEGLGPQDGFSEYNALSDTGVARPRWGDYGAAVASEDDTIWVANEYIAQTCTLQQYANPPSFAGFGGCGATRVTLANWATRISQIVVSVP